MNDRTAIQRIFASYSTCEFLDGKSMVDGEGNVQQSAPWLYESRFDDFLDEISYALVEGGVSRDVLMRVFLRHALRVLNANPDSIHAGSEENRNAAKLLDEIVRMRKLEESLREKVAMISQRLPMPLDLNQETNTGPLAGPYADGNRPPTKRK